LILYFVQNFPQILTYTLMKVNKI